MHATTLISEKIMHVKDFLISFYFYHVYYSLPCTVCSTAYSRIEFYNLMCQVIAREEGLVLHGPMQNSNYELLLQQPIENNCKTAFR